MALKFAMSAKKIWKTINRCPDVRKQGHKGISGTNWIYRTHGLGIELLIVSSDEIFFEVFFFDEFRIEPINR